MVTFSPKKPFSDGFRPQVIRITCQKSARPTKNPHNIAGIRNPSLRYRPRILPDDVDTDNVDTDNVDPDDVDPFFFIVLSYSIVLPCSGAGNSHITKAATFEPVPDV